MPQASDSAAKKIEKLTRAVNRRKQAFGKLRAGNPSAVSERHMRKLVKRAQRQRQKLLANQARHGVQKPTEAKPEGAEGTEGEPAPTEAPPAAEPQGS